MCWTSLLQDRIRKASYKPSIELSHQLHTIAYNQYKRSYLKPNGGLNDGF